MASMAQARTWDDMAKNVYLSLSIYIYTHCTHVPHLPVMPDTPCAPYSRHHVCSARVACTLRVEDVKRIIAGARLTQKMISLSLSIHIYIYTYVCIYIYTHTLNIHVCICIYIYIYIYTYKPLSSHRVRACVPS